MESEMFFRFPRYNVHMIKKKDILGHAWYMEHALAQARKALAQNEVPIGAVVVDAQGVIVASAYNKVERTHTQRAHAESLAMEKAAKKLGDWRLEECWLYVTLEPCGMCMHLAMMSRLKGLVYGEPSPLFCYHLYGALSNQLYKKHALEIISDVCSNDASELLKKFFKQKRIESRG
jgi:tRNA(adenine34) deaminase